MSPSASNFSRPVIGITMDVTEADGRVKVDCSLAYAACMERAGGVPVMLPPIAALIGDHLRLCDGFILTGGDDPKMEPFGVPTHPQAKVIHPLRQQYELLLLEALRKSQPRSPVLGICLGMQLMALHAGGKLNQYLPETLASHALHKNAEHVVEPVGASGLIERGVVWSNHRQAVADSGSLAVIARSEDGVIEAVADLGRAHYVGVQWHPEKTGDRPPSSRLFECLVGASRTGS